MPRACRFCNKPLSSLQAKRGQKFCSRGCKNKGQERRIEISCYGCAKKFTISLYLKRSTNYCSRECYWNSTRRKEKRKCKVCGKEFTVKAYLIEEGFGTFCSRECQHKLYPPQIVKLCPKCGKKFKVQPARADKRKFCSKICKDEFERDYVKRVCKNCKRIFEIPRWELNKGKGTFCSRDCYIIFNGESSIEAKTREALEMAGIPFEQEAKIGTYRIDFLLVDHDVVLECDGEYWHSRPWSDERDKRKDFYLGAKGLRVIRITEQTIKDLQKKELVQLINQNVNSLM